MSDHPQHHQLYHELHAHPFPVIHGSVDVAHLAVLREGWSRAEEDAHLGRLFAQRDEAPFAGGAVHHMFTLGPLQIRVERHNEFTGYTMLLPSNGRAFAGDPLALLPRGWLDGIDGQIVTRLRLTLMRRRDDSPHDPQMIACHLRRGQVVGSDVVYRNATVWTNFMPDADGWCRFLVEDRALSPERAGRLVLRILELETYRVLAMLSTPLARSALHQLPQLEDRLANIVEDIGREGGPDRERSQLASLTSLAVSHEHMIATTGRRFAASLAYHQLTIDRLRELRETEVPGYQTIAEFLDRRLTPAMRSVTAVAEHQHRLAENLANATDLLRTRVNLTLEAQNLRLLTSMDQRAALQLRLQSAVEGLSVAAISYYVVGLLKYLFEATEAMGWQHAPSGLLAGLCLPVVVLSVWWGMRRMRRTLHEP